MNLKAKWRGIIMKTKRKRMLLNLKAKKRGVMTKTKKKSMLMNQKAKKRWGTMMTVNRMNMRMKMKAFMSSLIC